MSKHQRLVEILSSTGRTPSVTSSGYYRTECPFRDNHQGSADGSNSFFVNPDKSFYKCFSCGVSGSLLSLLTTKYEIPFSEAVDLAVSLDLLNDAEDESVLDDGSDVPAYVPDRVYPAQPPNTYLDRGYSVETLRRFGVGYFLSDSGSEVVTIPVHQNKTLVAIMYVNRGDGFRKISFKPRGFQRKNVLYNEHEYRTTYLVEGPSDVWRVSQNSTSNVVASFGTELSNGQALRLRRYTQVNLAYDNDLAGTLAAEVAYRILSPHQTVRFVMYPGKDPGECDRASWLLAAKYPIDYMEYSYRMMVTYGDDYERILIESKKRLRKRGIF